MKEKPQPLTQRQQKDCVNYFQEMKPKKLRPCDCKDMATTMLLNERGIGFNEDMISIQPNVVVLTMGHINCDLPSIGNNLI